MYSTYHTYELKVKVNGRFVDEYTEPSTSNKYIEGRKGSAYSLWLKNNSHRRVLMIPSVDGLSVIDGEPASENSPGYVVDPWSSVEVKGWTKDSSKVNEFYFSSKDRSYAERTEQSTANIGVIGLLVFEEKPAVSVYSNFYKPKIKTRTYRDYEPQWKYYDNDNIEYNTGSVLRGLSMNSAMAGTHSLMSMTCSAGALASAPPVEEFSVGTGYGDEVEMKTYSTKFDKQSYPAERMALYYDDVKGLERRGIILKSSKFYTPDPFPKSRFGVKPPVK